MSSRVTKQRDPAVRGSKGRTHDRNPASKQACNHCHRRKVRCDISATGGGSSPCSNCRLKKIADCKVHIKRKTLSSSAAAASTSSTSTLPPALPLLRPKRAIDKEKPSYIHPIYTESHDDPAHESGNIADFLGKETIRTANLDHKSRVCYIGNEPSNFQYLVRQSSHLLDRDARIHHFSNRQYHPRHTSYRLDSLPADSFARPPPALERELLDAYFTHINCGWPIIDEEHFRIQVSGEDARDPVSLPLLNAVLLVGAHVLVREKPELKHHQADFFRRAKSLMDARSEQDRLIYVQSALLLTWYADGLEEVIANSWYWIGFAARTAIGIGMHRDPTHAKHPPLQRRSWIRTWWMLFQFDALMALAYGRPQAINLDDCDVPEITLGDLKGIPNAQADFVIAHSRLCILISQVMRHRWALRPTPTLNHSGRSVDQQLADFASHLPPSMGSPSLFPAASSGPNSSAPWRAILHLNYSTLVILLHREPPSSPDTLPPRNETTTANPIVAAEATTQTAAMLQSLDATKTLQLLNFFGVHAVWTTMLQLKRDIRHPNPLMASGASRTLKALLATLLELSYSWNFAQGLARLFGDADREADDLREQHQHNEQTTQQPTPSTDAEMELSESLFMDFGLLEDFFMGYEDNLA